MGSKFHILSWSSHKSNRTLNSIGDAQILATGEAIDEEKSLQTQFIKFTTAQLDLS